MVIGDVAPEPIIPVHDNPVSFILSSTKENSKKRRLEHDTTNSPPHLSTSSSRFFLCHYNMLKSLYSGQNPSIQDGLVSEEVWEMIEKFLDQAYIMQTARNEAIRAKHVYEESLIHLNTVIQKKQQMDYRVHPRDTSSTPATPLRRYAVSHPIEQSLQSVHTNSPMSFVARMIGGIAAASQNKAKRMVQSYLQVLNAVNARIIKLKAILGREMDKADGHDTDHDSATIAKNNKFTCVEVKIKISLWEILAADLYNVVKED